MKLTDQEKQQLVAGVEAIEIPETESTRGVVSVKFADAWEKIKPFVVLLGNFKRLRPFMESVVAGIDRFMAADQEEEEPVA